MLNFHILTHDIWCNISLKDPHKLIYSYKWTHNLSQDSLYDNLLHKRMRVGGLINNVTKGLLLLIPRIEITLNVKCELGRGAWLRHYEAQLTSLGHHLTTSRLRYCDEKTLVVSVCQYQVQLEAHNDAYGTLLKAQLLLYPFAWVDRRLSFSLHVMIFLLIS